MTHLPAQEKGAQDQKRVASLKRQSDDRRSDHLPSTNSFTTLAQGLNRTSRVQGAADLEVKLNGGPRVVAQKKLAQALSARSPKGSHQDTPRPSQETDLPDRLKAGVEQLSGVSLDGVRVHYSSSRPAQLQAAAFTQGSEIHVAPGQERHLPHEAWHAAQQLQGRVAPTTQLKGVALNNDVALEREADVMGARALQVPSAQETAPATQGSAAASRPVGPVQRYFEAPHRMETDAVEDYVAGVRPDLLRAFYDIKNADEETDLYDWINEHLNTDMHAIYDWQDGIVRGKPLDLNGEAVRGSSDIPEFSDDEMEDFRIGLDEAEYLKDELEELHHGLRMRGAPHDHQRREILKEHILEREMRAEYEHDDFEMPALSDSDDDGSGTDTDGSDSEDNVAFLGSDARRKDTARRLKRETKLIKPASFKNKLKKFRAAVDLEDPSDDSDDEAEESKKEKRPLKRDQAIRAQIFEKGTRPSKKGALFRKETKFLQPSVKVGDRAELPVPPTKQQTADLAQLNALLDLGIPIALAEKVITSKFVVAQYRGLFYSRKSFKQRGRAQHRGLDETDRPVFSSSALVEGPLGTAGYYYLYGAGRQGDLDTYQGLVAVEAQRIRAALLALREKEPNEEARVASGRATGNFQPKSLSDISTHFYSQDYDGYHEALAEKLSRGEDEDDGPLDPLFEGLPNASNPKVSTGDVPTHAARYAYGLKPYAGHEHEILEPSYDEDGKPKHPYSGKMYISMHPLTDYDEQGPEQLVELQREKRINIAKVILPERESPFEGMLGPGRVKGQLIAKFPNLSRDYKAVFEEKYGLTNDLFDEFQGAMQATEPGSDERVFVEALLSSYLAMHSEIRAIEAANRLAAQQGAKLVYRTGHRSFGFEPAPMSGEGTAAAEPLDLQAMLQMLAGEVTESSHKASSSSRSGEPARSPFGEVTRISGRGFACYIRSLVTAAAQMNYTPADEIEEMVDALQEHLAGRGLRNVGQDIDAGGLVAAEVRRILAELLHGFDPEVHIVQDNGARGWTEFATNNGAVPVYLRYTPGHFDLLSGPEH